MKTKLLIITNIITLSMLLYFYFQQSATIQPQSVTTTVENCEYDSSTLLDLQTARSLAKNYKESLDSLNINELRYGNPATYWYHDARSSWFSYNDLNRFLCAMKKDLGKEVDSSQLGVRVYYGRYPDNSNFKGQLESIVQQYEFKHCVFFVPTIDEGDFHRDFVKIIGKKSNIFSSKNHGNLVPPDGHNGSSIYNMDGSIISGN